MLPTLPWWSPAWFTRQGIAGNWLWWAFLPSGMMTVFLFSRLWRRSGLLTDVQFAEMRYSGKPAAFLRGFRAIYLGLLMNCLILGWVTKAMTSIVAVSLGVSETTALAINIFFLIPFTGIYVALGGLWGVLWTDLFQFVLQMAIVIAVAVFAVHAVGGMDALLSHLAVLRTAATEPVIPTAFFPDFSRGFGEQALWTVPVLTFVVYLGRAVVGLLVSGRRARRRRLHRAAHFQRAGRAPRPALRAVVQYRSLRRTSLALDSDGTGGHVSIRGLRILRPATCWS